VIRFLLRVVVFLGSAALGLLVAALLVPNFSVTVSGFLATMVVFAVVQSVITPFLSKTFTKRAPILLGGIGLISTFIALFVANLVPYGLSIRGIQAWVFATLLVWVVTSVATLLLPKLLPSSAAKRSAKPRS